MVGVRKSRRERPSQRLNEEKQDAVALTGLAKIGWGFWIKGIAKGREKAGQSRG